MRCIRRWWPSLALWLLVSGALADAQEADPGTGLSRLLQGRQRVAEPEPLRRVAEWLSAYRQLPLAEVAAADLQEAARLLDRARGLAAAGAPAAQFEPPAELAWAHLALAGRRMALVQAEQDRETLRRELAVLRQELSAIGGETLEAPAEEGGCR